ncbi:hypothetical protein NPIL_704101 [Nephila pilipes]|uniref:Uncharacterized protein n=1 Tax=Nephila pilipes TaxID=299642 RepID=A0A8X6I8B2_NEPPI|nr:hypothetical protein NPIL_704101 [Nephila pilipes]
MTRPGRRGKIQGARIIERTEDRFSGAPEGERGETPRRPARPSTISKAFVRPGGQKETNDALRWEGSILFLVSKMLDINIPTPPDGVRTDEFPHEFSIFLGNPHLCQSSIIRRIPRAQRADHYGIDVGDFSLPT